LVNSEEAIRKAFDDYIKGFGGNYKLWYVGIAENARDRLFKDHKVKQQGGAWILDDAGSRAIAERIEKYFQGLGAQGNPGGGSDKTRWVYAYKIEPYTIE